MKSLFLSPFCRALSSMAVLAFSGWTGIAHAQLLAPTQPVDAIIAVVEDDVILRSELDRAVSNILAQYADRRSELPPENVLQRQVLERLILVRLQVQRAGESGVRIADPEIEAALQNIAQNNRITVDQMRAQLEADGIPFMEFARSLRDEMIVQRLRQSVVQSRVQVSETEVDILLASNSLKTGQVRAANILVGLPDGASAEQIETARSKIEGVRDLIEKGEIEFSAAAIRYSDAPNALEGGDLGWRSYDEVPAMFASMLQGMQPGDVSPAVRGPSGFHMLKLLEVRNDDAQRVTEFSARHIMVKIDDVTSTEDAHSKIELLKARLDNGEAFDEVARSSSEDAMTRNQGGDLGWFAPYAFGQSIGDALLALSDGQISAPVLTDAGWHLVQRVAMREQDITDKVKRDQARETLGRRKSEEEYDRFLRQLREESYVESRLN
ncbi:MAG: peptidylprolyl isomerase [Xanthomonadales bacterium]|jgi:peptidyl-prolyl cis-trans isomerase SurA|nr:peptidylprolyl isomerase [Xanthomonadales bacterium]